jgi:23S rRNA pseudouridine2605 synthase
MNQRIQKVLAQAGFGSRREIESWITQGFIKINGEIAILGSQVTQDDKIQLKGKVITNPLKRTYKTRVLLYNKPEGIICTRNDPEKRKSVFDDLPKLRQGRWVMVGRLDINTQGLLVFTNNGELANKLMHPRYENEREYAVRILGSVDNSIIKSLLTGIELDFGTAKFNSVVYRGGEGANSWYHVTLSEGKNREVRKLWESQGVTVSRLIRVRFGVMNLPRYLRKGNYQELTSEQVNDLL